MWHVYIQVRIIFRASRVLVTLLFETSLFIITEFVLLFINVYYGELTY